MLITIFFVCPHCQYCTLILDTFFMSLKYKPNILYLSLGVAKAGPFFPKQDLKIVILKGFVIISFKTTALRLNLLMLI